MSNITRNEQTAFFVFLLLLALTATIVLDGTAYYLIGLPVWFAVGYVGTSLWQRTKEVQHR